MKSNLMIKEKVTISFLVIIFLLGLMFFLTQSFRQAGYPLSQPINKWIYSWDKKSWSSWNCQQGHIAKMSGCKYLWLKAKLPDVTSDKPMLYLHGIIANSLDVYLDNQRIYHDEAKGYIMKNKMLRQVFVPIPPSLRNKTIYLQLGAGDNSFLGLYGTALIGESRSILKVIFKHEFDCIVLGFFFIIFSGALLLIAFFLKEQRHKKLVFSLIVFGICLGIWNIAAYDNKDLLLFDFPYWFYCEGLSLLIAPIAGFYFYQQIFGSGVEKIVERIWQFHVIYLIPYLAIILLDRDLSTPLASSVYQVYYSNFLLKIIFIIESIIILFTLVQNMKSWVNTEMNILRGGLLILGLSLVYKNAYWANWGFFCFILSLILVLGYRFTSIHEQLKDYSFSLEQAVFSKTQELTQVLNTLEDRNKELSNQAITDPLTKIFNRLKFNQCLEKAVNQIRDGDNTFSVIMFDIDYFKQINDNHGHLIGDYVLVEIAQIISGSLREIDLFARWGGEEFIILTLNTDLHTASLLAERLRRKVEQHNFHPVGTITCSFGVTQYYEGDSPDSILQRVDEVLYIAKKSGKNRVQMI